MIQEYIDFIDNLYEKLENSSEDITNLLMDFYYNKSTYLFFIKEFPDEAKNKIYTIFKYIIKNSDSLFKDNPYVISELVDTYKHSLQGFVVRPYMGDYQANNSNINTIFLMYEQYVDFKSFIKENNICDNTDEMNKSSIDSLVSEETERLFLESYIMNLNNGFFELDIELVKKLLNYVRNNEWIDNFINGNYKIDMYTRNFAYQYLTKFTFIKDFSTDEELVNDKLLNAIVKGNLVDYDLYNLVIDNIDIHYILGICNDDLSKILGIIDNNIYDTKEKDELVNKIFNKVKIDYPEKLFKFYIENQDNSFVNKFLNKKELDDLIYEVLQTPIRRLDSQIIDFILEKELWKKNFLFVINFYFSSKYNEMNDRQKELIEPIISSSKLKDNMILFNNNQIAQLVNIYVNEGSQISQFVYIAIIKSLINIILGKDVDVLYFATPSLKKSTTGYYNVATNELGINIISIYEKLDLNKEEDYKKFIRILVKIFNTIFHECEHYKQFDEIENNEQNIDYLKNYIIRHYYPNYYEKNYKIIDYEIDARIKAYENTLNYLMEYYSEDKYFPGFIYVYKELCEAEYLKDLELDYSKKKMFKDNTNYNIDIIFDRFIQFHPEIIDNFPVLKKQYDENGNRIETSLKK